VPNPLLLNSLVTISTPNSGMTYSGYSSVLLSGSTFTPQIITTTLQAASETQRRCRPDSG